MVASLATVVVSGGRPQHRRLPGSASEPDNIDNLILGPDSDGGAGAMAQDSIGPLQVWDNTTLVHPDEMGT